MQLLRSPVNRQTQGAFFCLLHPHGLRLACLEKRSQALQGCNLTRNIQVDGVPMAHPPGGVFPAGLSFSHHRTPEPCLENPTSKQQATLSLTGSALATEATNNKAARQVKDAKSFMADSLSLVKVFFNPHSLNANRGSCDKNIHKILNSPVFTPFSLLRGLIRRRVAPVRYRRCQFGAAPTFHQRSTQPGFHGQ